MIKYNFDQYSDDWDRVRLGLPTASSANSLLTTKLELSKSLTGYAYKLAGDLYAGASIDRWDGNKYTERGHEIEPEARAWYQMIRDVDVSEIGFATDDKRRFGCSPDGVLPGGELVEIKCLPVQHIKSLMFFRTHKRPPTDYVMQCHFQMLVCDAPRCDLVYYHPQLPKLILPIFRDPGIDVALLSAIDECIGVRDKTLTQLRESKLWA